METWNKKENEKNRQKKKKEKEEKREERKANAKEGGKKFEDMIMYVDENGNFTSIPPDPNKKSTVKEEDIVVSVPRQSARKQEDPIRKGTVTFFNNSKGYGFIKDQDSQDSIFVHLNGLVDQIKDNDKVIFEVEMGHKGPNAVNVKLVKP